MNRVEFTKIVKAIRKGSNGHAEARNLLECFELSLPELDWRRVIIQAELIELHNDWEIDDWNDQQAAELAAERAIPQREVF